MDQKPTRGTRPNSLRQCHRFLSSSSILVGSTRRSECGAADHCPAEFLYAPVSYPPCSCAFLWPRASIRALGGTLHGLLWNPAHGFGGVWWGRSTDLPLYRRARSSRLFESERSRQGQTGSSGEAERESRPESVSLRDRPSGRRAAEHGGYQRGLGNGLFTVSKQQD